MVKRLVLFSNVKKLTHDRWPEEPSPLLSFSLSRCQLMRCFTSFLKVSFRFVSFRLGSQGGGVPLAMRRHYDGLVLEMLGVFLLSCAHFDHNRSNSHLCIPNWAVNLFLGTLQMQLTAQLERTVWPCACRNRSVPENEINENWINNEMNSFPKRF